MIKSSIALTVFIGGVAWWLSAAPANTAHEDDIAGYGGSFILSLSNPLFSLPSYHVPNGTQFNKNSHPANWSAGFKKALDDFGFDNAKNDILWQHGHAGRAHLVKVYKYPNSTSGPFKVFSVKPATAADPSPAINITLTGAAGSQISVRLVMAKTGPAPLNTAACVDIYTTLPAGGPQRAIELAKRVAELKGRKGCVEGHKPGLGSENMDYSWLVLTDRKLKGPAGTWTPLPDPNADQSRRLYEYLGSGNVKLLRIEVPGPEGGLADLAAAQCSFFQICHNNADGTSTCSKPPVITRDPQGVCRYNGKKATESTSPLPFIQ